MRRKRQLSQQEALWVSEYIESACGQAALDPQDEEYRSAGWASFMTHYRSCDCLWAPDFWSDVQEHIAEAIWQEKQKRTARLYQELSLNRLLLPESNESFLDLLPARSGDFTNGVAFFDYIGHLPQTLRCLARYILEGYTLEEARSHLGWSAETLLSAVEELRRAMRAYEEI